MIWLSDDIGDNRIKVDDCKVDNPDLIRSCIQIHPKFNVMAGCFGVDLTEKEFLDDFMTLFKEDENEIRVTVEDVHKKAKPTDNPGFGAIFSIAGLLAIAYLLRRRK